MESLRINIRNPKARRLLEDMADLDLIEIKPRDEYKKDFLDLVNRLRAKGNEFSLEEISEEVKEVRKKK